MLSTVGSPCRTSSKDVTPERTVTSDLAAAFRCAAATISVVIACCLDLLSDVLRAAGEKERECDEEECRADAGGAAKSPRDII